MITTRKQQWVNFVGPLNEEACEDCQKAVEGNPWPIESAPQPGLMKCGDKCRHVLQVIDKIDEIKTDESMPEKPNHPVTISWGDLNLKVLEYTKRKEWSKVIKTYELMIAACKNDGRPYSHIVKSIELIKKEQEDFFKSDKFLYGTFAIVLFAALIIYLSGVDVGSKTGNPQAKSTAADSQSKGSTSTNNGGFLFKS